jgi:hypothetical protein
MGTQAYAAQLFESQGTSRANAASHISGTRDVRINPGAFNQSTLEFSLDGVDVSAVRTKIDRRQGEVIWTGHVQGNPGESVIFTARGNHYSGSIFANGNAYTLSGTRNGTQSLHKLDLSALPPEDIGGIPDGGGTITHDANVLGEAVQQDLLVVYTQAACNASGGCAQLETDITTAIAQMNQAYSDSGIDIISNVTSMRLINYADSGVSTGTALGQIASTSDGIMDEVHGWRDNDGADMVALIMDGSGCGTAYAPASASSAFNVSDVSCYLGNRTLSHEIGHNQGALHDRDQHSGGTVGGYNYGYKRCSDGSDEDFGSPYFRTIMSYSCASAGRVGRFSNPDLTYLGVPYGVDPDVDPARGAFNARRLNERATTVANFRPSVAQNPPAAPSNLGASTNGPDAINLVWTDNASDESGFAVERSADNVNFVEIGTVSANITSYADNGLAPETTYYYRVEANNGAGASGFSNTASATTDILPSTVDHVAQSQILGTGSVSGGYSNTHTDNGSTQTITETGSGGPKHRRKQSYTHTYSFDVLGGAGGVVLNANAYVSGSEGANFDYSIDGGVNWNLMFTVSSTAIDNMNNFAFPGGTSGSVLVRVSDAEQINGEGVDSVSIDSIIITSNTIPGTPPAQPSGLITGMVTSSSVALSFVDNADNEFGFEIWRSETSPSSCSDGFSIDSVVSSASTGGTVNYTDTGAAPATTYWYFAKAYNGASDGSLCSNADDATTDIGAAITASGNGYKDKGAHTVDLTWSGALGGSVDIRRNGAVVATTANDGFQTDNIGAKGGGSYTYEICEVGSAVDCSDSFPIIF